jgi:hypothetical protein
MQMDVNRSEQPAASILHPEDESSNLSETSVTP